MKKLNALFLFVVFTLVSSTGLFAASYKSIARDDISRAKKLEKKLKSDKNLQEYIPYQNYHDGINYLKSAARQYDDESEYEIASYYGVLSRIEFEIAKMVAETREYRHKILLAERDEYKNAAKAEMLKAAIAGARLVKKGKAYFTNIEDKLMFKSRSLKLLDKGEDVLNKIYQVTKLYPESKLFIKGHTRYRDRDNKKSRLKADKIAEFFIMTKGVEESRIDVKGIGDQEPMEVSGRDRKVDRVEIIITGVD